MASFDLDATLAALEKPSVTKGNRTYEGRLLSILEFQPFFDRAQKIFAGTSDEDFGTFCAAYLRTIFPKPFFAWQYDPVPDLLASPKLSDAITGFFMIQAAANGLTPTDRKTSGTELPSKAKTEVESQLETNNG